MWAREEAPRCLSCHRVIIPIGPLKHATKTRWNALHLAHAKLPVGADRDASGMRSTCGEPGGDDRFHPVARLETPDLLLAHEIAAWKATLVTVGATIASSPHRRDDHRLEPARIDPRQISHAERVQGVRFGEAEARPVPARAPSAPGANGQPQLLKLAHQCVTRRVDRGGVPERGLGLRLHLWVAELGRRPVALGQVAVVACQHEVGHAIGAAPAAGQLVIELEGHLPLATIRAAVPEFLQHIGPRLPAGQFTPLVLEAADFCVLQQLRIECDAFHLDAPDGRPPAVAARPIEHVADPRGKRGREPPAGTRAVVEAPRSVAQVGATAATAMSRALEHGLMHGGSAVAYLCEVQGVMVRALLRCLLPHNGHARGLAARVDLERHRL